MKLDKIKIGQKCQIIASTALRIQKQKEIDIKKRMRITKQ